MDTNSLEKKFENIRMQVIKKAKDEKVSEVEVIKSLIRKLRDPSRDEKYFKGINTEGISEEVIEALIGYLKSQLKIYNQRDRINANKEKRVSQTKLIDEKWESIQARISELMSEREGSSKLENILIIMEEIRNGVHDEEFSKKDKRIIIKRLEELEAEEIKKQQEKATEAKKQSEANKIWEQICERIKMESINGDRPEVEYWIAIRETLFNEQEGEIQTDLRMSKGIKQRVKQLLDDEIYYQDVKYYTEDFTFLRDFPEVALGHTPRRGFYDTKSLLKYDDLRVELQTTWDEYRKISRLLETETDDATIRVLQSRKTAIEKQRERRKQEGRDI